MVGSLAAKLVLHRRLTKPFDDQSMFSPATLLATVPGLATATGKAGNQPRTDLVGVEAGVEPLALDISPSAQRDKPVLRLEQYVYRTLAFSTAMLKSVCVGTRHDRRPDPRCE